MVIYQSRRCGEHAAQLQCGSIAQLGEHLPYKQRVTGSSPVVPTIQVAWQFSWLERQPVTLEVVGSSPIQVAKLPLQLSWQSRGLKIPVSLVRLRSEAPFYADLAHLVERHLAKVEVASSSLVIRSKGRLKLFKRPFIQKDKAPQPSGKAEVCKTSMPRFKSGWRLQKGTTIFERRLSFLFDSFSFHLPIFL